MIGNSDSIDVSFSSKRLLAVFERFQFFGCHRISEWFIHRTIHNGFVMTLYKAKSIINWYTLLLSATAPPPLHWLWLQQSLFVSFVLWMVCIDLGNEYTPEYYVGHGTACCKPYTFVHSIRADIWLICPWELIDIGCWILHTRCNGLDWLVVIWGTGGHHLHYCCGMASCSLL